MILTKGHPLSVKKRILCDYAEKGEKFTCIEHVITRSTLRRLIEFKDEIMNFTQDDIDKMTKERRKRTPEYSKQWKLRNNPGNKRKKHPFKVIAGYANSNYKLVCYRNKIKFNNEDIIKPLDLWKLAKKQKCLCAVSGEPLTCENVSVDHILPVSQGGKNSVSNIRLTVQKINRMRNDMTDKEFFDLCNSVVKSGLLK